MIITLFSSLVFVLLLENGLVGLDCLNIFFVKSLLVDSHRFFLGAVDCPPHAPFMKGTFFLPDLIDNMHNYSSKIIMDDFNSDPQSNRADAEFIWNFVDKNSLSSIPLGTTYHRENVDSELNLCMVDGNDVVCQFYESEAPLSDGHDMITVAVVSPITPEPATDFTYRDLKQ